MKTTAFFCENCGKPVPLTAKVCPHCQRRFDAVRCPKCQYVGKPPDFRDGCPSCGYLKGTIFNSDEAGSGAPGAAKGARKPAARRRPKRKAAPPIRFELPGWAYSAAAVILLGVLGVLGYILVKLINERGG